MTRQQAIEIVERMGVDPDDTDSIEDIVTAVRNVDYGDGHATETELAELRHALVTLRAF